MEGQDARCCPAFSLGQRWNQLCQVKSSSLSPLGNLQTLFKLRPQQDHEANEGRAAWQLDHDSLIDEVAANVEFKVSLVEALVLEVLAENQRLTSRIGLPVNTPSCKL